MLSDFGAWLNLLCGTMFSKCCFSGQSLLGLVLLDLLGDVDAGTNQNDDLNSRHIVLVVKGD